MKNSWLAWTRRYRSALKTHLRKHSAVRGLRALTLGQQALALGMASEDLERIHLTTLTVLARSDASFANRNRLAPRAGVFLAQALQSLERNLGRATPSSDAKPKGNKTLTRLTTANRHLKEDVRQRKSAERILRTSVRHHENLLRKSHLRQDHLRHLTHRLLSGLEAERKKISHELQDEVAQSLLGIHVRLLTLKKSARDRRADLTKEIASTQKIVKESAQSIKQFAQGLDIHQPA